MSAQGHIQPRVMAQTKSSPQRWQQDVSCLFELSRGMREIDMKVYQRGIVSGPGFSAAIPFSDG